MIHSVFSENLLCVRHFLKQFTDENLNKEQSSFGQSRMHLKLEKLSKWSHFQLRNF